MPRDLCQYCYEKPVASVYQYSCTDCTYVCEGCEQVTPYESGGADDMPEHCDKCWHNAHKDLVR